MKITDAIEQLPRWQPAYDDFEQAVDMVRTDDGDFIALVDVRALLAGHSLGPVPANGSEFYRSGYKHR